MNTFFQDVRFALRLAAKSPLFTGVIVLTLALGIGANTAIFSVVNAVVLQPLPFDDPDRLVMIWETDPPRGNMQAVTSYPSAADWREMNHVFEQIGTFYPTNHTLTGVDQPRRLSGARVSSDFLSLLHVQPALGRLPRPVEDQLGAENVVLLSHAFWEQHFGGDSGVIDQTLSLDGTPFSIIGVLPKNFSFPVRMADAEVWTTPAQDESFMTERPIRLLCAAGRLKAGVTLDRAQSDMDRVIRLLKEQYPDVYDQTGIRLTPLLEQVVGDVRPTLLLLLGAVGLVLLVACANIASLLLIRGMSRQAELAVRAAMGAGRGRIVRQLLTECALIGALGGVCGVQLAVWGIDALVALAPEDVPRMQHVNLDARVLCFALAATLLTSLFFGLAPALSATRWNLHASLKDAGRTSAAAGRQRLRAVLVVSEVAVALVLLIGAGLLTRSFQRVMDVDLGFNPDSVLEFYLDVGFSKPLDLQQRAAFYDELLRRIEGLPGVEAAFAGTSLPLRNSRIGFGVVIEGRPMPPLDQIQSARHCAVTADYFQDLGIPLLRGRFFTETDNLGKPGVMIINETMAKRCFPEEDPIGKSIRSGMRLSDEEPQSYEIVGIVGDVKDAIPGERRPYMYVPYSQQTWPFMSFGVRTTVDPKSLIGAVRAEVAALTREEAAFEFQTMDERLGELVARRRFTMFLLALFAGTALVLAAVGLYGTLAHGVAQRTHEIGVRMALGAQRADVLRLVLRQGGVLIAIGSGIGLTAALAGSHLLMGVLYGISPHDPATFTGVPLLLLGVALLACYLPARRAAKIDPMSALRCE